MSKIAIFYILLVCIWSCNTMFKQKKIENQSNLISNKSDSCKYLLPYLKSKIVPLYYTNVRTDGKIDTTKWLPYFDINVDSFYNTKYYKDCACNLKIADFDSLYNGFSNYYIGDTIIKKFASFSKSKNELFNNYGITTVFDKSSKKYKYTVVDGYRAKPPIIKPKKAINELLPDSCKNLIHSIKSKIIPQRNINIGSGDTRYSLTMPTVLKIDMDSLLKTKLYNDCICKFEMHELDSMYKGETIKSTNDSNIIIIVGFAKQEKSPLPDYTITTVYDSKTKKYIRTNLKEFIYKKTSPNK